MDHDCRIPEGEIVIDNDANEDTMSFALVDPATPSESAVCPSHHTKLSRIQPKTTIVVVTSWDGDGSILLSTRESYS